jgi:hypothetical protein
MEENAMVTTDRLLDLYWQLVSEKEALEAKEEHIKQLRSKVMELMGDKEIVYDSYDPDIRKVLFTIVEVSDYYKVDTEELKECAPLIWELHQKLVKGNRSLRVNFKAFENAGC